MEASKEIISAAAHIAKRRIENSLTEAEKTDKVVAEADRQRKKRNIVKVTAEQKFEKSRVEAGR